MDKNSLAIHETLELHDLLSFKTVCLTKSATMQALVSDERLKALMQKDIQNSKNHIEELKNLLTHTTV